jgi:hypothetical protein
MSAPNKVVTAGKPTGPLVFVKELGIEVPTFDIEAGGSRPALKHHVPLEYRGDFRPKDLANYDSNKTYRVDPWGKVLCYGKTVAGGDCSKRAQNRSPLCDVHGGRIHPLDRVVKDKETSADSDQSESLSRYRQFQAGQITVDDLDDEELAACGFRSSNGSIFRPRNVPRELAQAFTRAIYERAEAEIRSLAIDAAHTIGEIMKNKTNEPDIRLKAAITLIERNLGKTPQAISVAIEKPWEEVFDSITHVRSERPSGTKQLESAIDAEVVGGDESRSDPPNAEAQSRNRNTTESVKQESVHGTADRQDTSDVGHAEQSIDQPKRDEQSRDARLFSRNPAILAQSLEIKPFEYDLGDNRKQIENATRKRYATKLLGAIDGDSTPLVRHIKKLKDGTLLIRHTEPVEPKVPKAKRARDERRKRFTLSDFD